MPEDVVKHFVFPNLTTLVLGALREVLDKGTTQIDKISLNG